MIKKTIQKLGTLLFLSSLLILNACGGGGGGTTTAPIGDITGRWTVTSETDARDCDEGFVTDVRTVDVASQSGNTINVLVNGSSFTGNFNGNSLTWNGSYPEDGGTTQENITLTVAASCNSFSGSSTWSWSDGIDSCSGTAEATGTRNDPIGCGGDGGSSAPTLEVEPNDTPSTAQAITLPAAITGSTDGSYTGIAPGTSFFDFVFTPNSGPDVYSFTVTSIQTVTVNLTGPDNVDMDLWGMATNGNIIEISDDPNSTESLTGNFAPGTYLVAVIPFDVSNSTSYTLTVE